jgi:hypothetical protein
MFSVVEHSYYFSQDFSSGLKSEFSDAWRKDLQAKLIQETFGKIEFRKNSIFYRL